MDPIAFHPRQVYEQVADQLRGRIADGTYEIGSRLPAERELARLLDVSRPAVREAIGALQNEGIVTTRHGSGTYVVANARDPSSADTSHGAAVDFSPIDTLRVRLLIEPAFARIASKRHQRDLVAEDYLAQMESIEDIDDPVQQARWSNTDRLFHHRIALMTGDALIRKIADEISQVMKQPLWNRLRDDGIYKPERIHLYVAEHRLIYEAVVTGDEDAAAFYVERHLNRVRHDITTPDQE